MVRCLSSFETECIVPRIISLIEMHHSRPTKITDELIAEQLIYQGIGVTPHRVHVMTGFIRARNLIPRLIKDLSGEYHIAKTDDEVMEHIDELMHEAALCIAGAHALDTQLFKSDKQLH